jgi:hypothetical protein
MYKVSTKPLQGATYDTSFETSIIDSDSFQDVISTTVISSGLDNVTITNSIIESTNIGSRTPGLGQFSELRTFGFVGFYNRSGGLEVQYNPVNNIFSINGELNVRGCSILGNIEICNNNISSKNFNGNINILPNGTGELNVRSPFFNVSSHGNFFSNMTNGSYTFIGKDEFRVVSSDNSINLFAKNNISLNTTNGNIILSTDNGIADLQITSITKISGVSRITTNSNHNLQTGDTVVLSSTNSVPSFNGTYTVTQILSPTQFSVNDTINLISNGTTGIVRKNPSNIILLDSDFLVSIPSDTRLTFGPTQNNLYGNTSGLYFTSISDFIFSLPTSSNILLPQTSKLQFGTSGNSFLQFDGSSFNLNSPLSTLNGSLLQINNTNVRFRDPILTIADYTLSSNDLRDRGIDFRYFDTSQKLGWFGYKNSLNAFTFITNATNSNEQISGDIANFVANDLRTTSVTLNTGGNINLNCGLIQNVNTIRGCGTTLNIDGPGIINLTATSNINFPNNIPINIGTSRIIETSARNLSILSPENILFSTQTNGSIVISTNTKLSFDNTTRGNQYILSNTSGEFVINGSKSIYISTTDGNIIIPVNTSLQLGLSTQTLTGRTGGITLLSANGNLNLISSSTANIITSSGNLTLSNLNGDIILTPTNGNIRIPITRSLIFGLSGTVNRIQSDTSGNLNIIGNGSNGNIKMSSVNEIDILANSNINIPQLTRFNFGLDKSKSIFGNSTQLIIENNSSGEVVITSGNTSFLNTNTLFISNSFTNITSNNITISGSVTNLNSTNVQISDPIVSIAYNLIDPIKDRGIEYNWVSSGNSRLGWFGYKSNTGKFTFYSDAINTNEVISGTLGELQVSNLSLQSNGYLDVSCGEIRSVRLLSACTGTIEITAENILLSANSQVLIPFGKPIHFGSSNNSISGSVSEIVLNSSLFNINSSINLSNSFKTNDPILSVGGLLAPVSNDLKDRGIEYFWYDETSSKLGFFGYKNNTGRFVFIKEGTNTNEIFSGIYGDVEFGNGYFSNLNLNNGTISGIQELSGGSITIKTTSGNIFLSPSTSGSILLPFDSKLAFGNTENSISSNSNGNLLINSSELTLSPNDSLRLTDNVPFYFGNDNNVSIQRTGDSLNITTSSGNIYLTPEPSVGNVILPIYNSIAFNDTTNRIFSDGSKLYLIGNNGIQFDGNVNFTGVLTATQLDFDIDKYILPLGKYQTRNITDIRNTVTPGITRIITSLPHYLSIGDKVILTNTNSVPSVNGEYAVTSIVNDTIFTINTGVNISIIGGIGTLRSNLMTNQEKDVGIQVNYWKNKETEPPLSLITAGSLFYKTGFFGFKLDTERWTFYDNAIIIDDVASGTLGNIEINTLYTNQISGFTLLGDMSAGNNIVSGNNFKIEGGTINQTPIGQNGPAPGTFSTIVSNASSKLAQLELKDRLVMSFERLRFNSDESQFLPIDTGKVVTFFSVDGTGFQGASSTMSNFGVLDGTYKMIVCSKMGNQCSYTIHFPLDGTSGTLIAPNPLNIDPLQQPTKIIFKRQSQSVQLIYDSTSKAWILLNSGAYVS